MILIEIKIILLYLLLILNNPNHINSGPYKNMTNNQLYDGIIVSIDKLINDKKTGNDLSILLK